MQGPGCGQAAPGPPTNLKASPGDGRVTLTWGPPSNGACVNLYQITAIPVGAASSLSSAPPLSTQQFTYTVTGLRNGQEYRFIVTAVSYAYPSQPQSATVTATPGPTPPPTPPPNPVYQVCSAFIYPAGPANLRTTKVGSTSVTLCWDPPPNYGCADYYSLTVTPLGGLQALSMSPIRIQSTKCYTVNNLQKNSQYRASVQSYSNFYNGGGTSSITFTTTS